MARCLLTFNFRQQGPHPCAHIRHAKFRSHTLHTSKISLAKLDLSPRVAMDARFMQMHNLVLTREVLINSMFPVDRMRKINFHRETAVH